MTSSFQFTATVAPEAMSKVSRLFNSSITDILNELLQNSRRSGATTVTIEHIEDPAFGPALRLADNGPGLADCRALFTLGRSSWHDGIEQSEDAAGMGFMSLATRGARIVAQKCGCDGSWVLDASAAAFAGNAPVIGSEGPDDHRGMTVIVPLTPSDDVAVAVTRTARYCPLVVTFDGQLIEARDFLKGALHVEEWSGIRIGVFDCAGHGFRSDNVNFFGVTLRTDLPWIGQVFHPDCHARIDVTDCAALKFVLPARKEIVRDEFFEDLQAHIRTVMFRYVATREGHSLSFEDYQRAGRCGVDLPEASMLLRRFTPRFADSTRDYGGPIETVTPRALLFNGGEGPIDDQTIIHALYRLEDDLVLYQPEGLFAGYTWYDTLRCVALKGYEAHFGSMKQGIEPGARLDAKTRPDRLQVMLECSGPAVPCRENPPEASEATPYPERWGNPPESFAETWTLETDVILLGEDYASLDGVDVVISAGSLITPADLADLLEVALFCPSDDVDADSWDHQRGCFCDEAEDLGFKLLQSHRDADINAIIRTIHRELLWRLPSDCPVTIHIDGQDIRIDGLS